MYVFGGSLKVTTATTLIIITIAFLRNVTVTVAMNSSVAF